MKIYKIAVEKQMMMPTPGAPTSQGLNIQIQNLQMALPLLGKFTEIANKATQASEIANDIGQELGVTGMGDQLMNSMKATIANTADFKSLVQINAVGSVEEIFNAGDMSLKATKMNQQLQDAQQAQAQLGQAQSGAQGALTGMGYQ